jgi:hypothetical protein
MTKRKALNQESINRLIDEQLDVINNHMDQLLLQVVNRNTISDIIYRTSIERQVLNRLKNILNITMEGDNVNG